MKYYDIVNKEKSKYFSLNFLLAESNDEPEPERDFRFNEKKISCEVYETSDFSTHAYYKQMSSIVKNFIKT